jgi:hypothetical protein
LYSIGIEPMTFCLSNKHSNLLSYEYFGRGGIRTLGQKDDSFQDYCNKPLCHSISMEGLEPSRIYYAINFEFIMSTNSIT